MLGFIFPEVCLICAENKGYICNKCLKTFPRPCFKCFRCSRKNPFGLYCTSCRKKDLPDRILAGLAYQGKLKDAIYQYKFEDAYKLSEDFSKSLIPIVKGIKNYKRYVLTFVPLSRSRERYRGYNQSKLLADKVACYLKMQVLDLLERKGQDETQVTSKTKLARKRNIKGVFSVKKDIKIPENIILIDDVVTTGATVEEATRVLKRAGVKKVVVVALAMGAI